MSKRNRRRTFIVQIKTATSQINHEINGFLYQDYVRSRFIIPTTEKPNTATVHPRFRAWIEEEKTLRFEAIKSRPVRFALSSNLGIVLYLLWLFHVEIDKQGNPIYQAQFDQHDALYA